MAAGIRTAPIKPEEFERLLPLIAAYQRFYRAPAVDEERNREFFRRFVEPSEEGMLIGAWQGGDLVGYACLFWAHSSLAAADAVLLNDLFVVAEARGSGIGRGLIEAAASVGRDRGAVHLEWSTEPGNATAQRLYDSTGAIRSEWVVYELPL